MQRSKSWMLAGAVAALWMVLVSRYFPSAGEYRASADEGAYFRQAGTIVDQGFRGFSELGRVYVAERSDLPSPLRIGHISLSALALSVNRSFRALSYLSASCYAATVLLIFAFARKLWDDRIAVLASLLALSSPLANGLALRALSDTHGCLASMLALLSFAALVVRAEQKYLWVFAASLAWSLLVKETAYLLLPFYAGVLLLERVKRAHSPRSIHTRALLAVALVPLLTLAISMALLGGPTRFYEVVRIVTALNAINPHPYLEAFGAGPWYEYFIDFLLLSPLTALLFLAFCGHVIASADKSRATALVLSFFAFYLVILAALPKNPRFSLPLDPLLRIGVAGMLVTLTQQFKTRTQADFVLAAALAVLLVFDLRAFAKYFVAGKIYDPIAYNLLAAARIIPTSSQTPTQTQTAEAFFALSLRQYQAHAFAESIAASQEAIRLRPEYADAFNNLGLAYAELGDWNQAIAALEEAIRLRPSYQLARNNLAWIRTRASGAAR